MKKFWFIFLTVLCVYILLNSWESNAKDLRVMVIDTGIDATHPYLKPYVVDSKDENMVDTHGHGTFIAGIIAATKCEKLKIISCKAFAKKTGQGELNMIVGCLDRAYREGIDIVNISGGGNTYDAPEEEAVKKLEEKNVPVVVAAGNEGKFLGSPCFNYWPACLGESNIVTVGALGRNGERWVSSSYQINPANGRPLEIHSSSNYGKPEMIWRVGEDIKSTSLNHGYTTLSGTSMATALYTHYLVKKKCSEE